MKEWIKDIVIAVIVAVIIMQFIKPTIVKETSMQPTLYENNYIFLSKQAYRFSEPEKGDIIVFHTDLKTQAGKEKLLIKRVIGLPGDVINIKDGKLFINDELQEEDYTLEPYTSGFVEDLEVPEGCLFVMGDNRQNSADSRDPSVGFVKIDEIIGKAVFRLYPFSEIGSLH
ncbi:signal peptidase I [Sinanaerobacter chloroacetimidivorans]|jgi:signal peptidase I|uniref:Signal peptidase I n=1 Tax=Sinanaerobacter chloroacetimidivorans TaxID=2818044 RepID=A0A8J8B0I3_9FIRM|nr:signal peptidase I [Sinanaerobacter chloroacetimidivorans]MBR0597638.1 signal peptidase I [Sinanaerobacter chloroacetimidivorans]